MPMPTKELQREYQRRWVAQRRATFFADKECARCGAVESLELDHIDPALKIHHAIWSWSQQRRDAEVAKCQVLCAECHKVKTFNEDENRRKVTHGSTGMYKKPHSCKCVTCRAFKSRENAKRYTG